MTQSQQTQRAHHRMPDFRRHRHPQKPGCIAASGGFTQTICYTLYDGPNGVTIAFQNATGDIMTQMQASAGTLRSAYPVDADLFPPAAHSP